MKGFEAGAVDYITKPLHPQEVLARVRAHLQLRELQQTLEDEVQCRTALETQLQHSLDRAVLMVAPDGRVPFLTRRAEQMLARHAPLADGHLPVSLRTLLRAASRPGALELATAAGTLRLRRFAEAGHEELVLLVLEERLAVPALDPLLALGLTGTRKRSPLLDGPRKTNPEIAIILEGRHQHGEEARPARPGKTRRRQPHHGRARPRSKRWARRTEQVEPALRAGFPKTRANLHEVQVPPPTA
ncbi:MAG: hypothetical protein WDM96_02440 [Lacunisphaera sp.]